MAEMSMPTSRIASIACGRTWTGFDTGAGDLEPVASVVSQEAFGHLASG
jgi:hypothetical protein